MKHAAIHEDMKHPLILPHDHRISHLIVQEYHGAAHLGNEWTLSQVRQRYWITKARNIIKMTKRSCVTCNKLYGVGMHQNMAELPPERCEPGRPAFSYVGVDLYGPIYVKLG